MLEDDDKFSVKVLKISFSFALCNPRVLCSNSGIQLLRRSDKSDSFSVTFCSEWVKNIKFYENPFRGPGSVTSCRTTRRTDLTDMVKVINSSHLFIYFVLWPTNIQLFLKLSYSHIFRHYLVIHREFVIHTLQIYTSVSNASVGNKFTVKMFHIGFMQILIL